MPLPPPAATGMPLAEVDTPALLLDLDAFERNVATMAEAARGLRLRPHAKSHKCPEIALRQIAAGAVGVCCQKVSEAAAMVDGGVGDVLVSNEIVGRAKLARLAELAKRARVERVRRRCRQRRRPGRRGARCGRAPRRAGRSQRRREPLRRRAGRAGAAPRARGSRVAAPPLRRHPRVPRRRAASAHGRGAERGDRAGGGEGAPHARSPRGRGPRVRERDRRRHRHVPLRAGERRLDRAPAGVLHLHGRRLRPERAGTASRASSRACTSGRR